MRYGVQWPDGSVTGLITDKQRLAAHYANEHDGTVYDEDHQPDKMPGHSEGGHDEKRV